MVVPHFVSAEIVILGSKEVGRIWRNSVGCRIASFRDDGRIERVLPGFYRTFKDARIAALRFFQDPPEQESLFKGRFAAALERVNETPEDLRRRLKARARRKAEKDSLPFIIERHAEGWASAAISYSLSSRLATRTETYIRRYLIRRGLIPHEDWLAAEEEDWRIAGKAQKAKWEAQRKADELAVEAKRRKRLADWAEARKRQKAVKAAQAALAKAMALKRRRREKLRKEEVKRAAAGLPRYSAERRKRTADHAPAASQAAAVAAKARRDKLIPLIVELYKRHGSTTIAAQLNDMGVSRERANAGPWTKHAVMRLLNAAKVDTTASKSDLIGPYK